MAPKELRQYSLFDPNEAFVNGCYAELSPFFSVRYTSTVSRRLDWKLNEISLGQKKTIPASLSLPENTLIPDGISR